MSRLRPREIERYALLVECAYCQAPPETYCLRPSRTRKKDGRKAFAGEMHRIRLDEGQTIRARRIVVEERLADPWAQPATVSDVDLAFPANGGALTPLPGKDYDPKTVDPAWERLASQWFNEGLPSTIGFVLRPGVDGERMLRHMRVVLGTYATKHEHKIAGAGYLLSRWCYAILRDRDDSSSVIAGELAHERSGA